MKQAHHPADAEQRSHEAAEAIQAVTEPLLVGFLGHHTEDDAAHQSKKKSGFKMIEFHSLVLLAGANLVGVDDGKNVEQTSGDDKFRAVVG